MKCSPSKQQPFAVWNTDYSFPSKSSTIIISAILIFSSFTFLRHSTVGALQTNMSINNMNKYQTQNQFDKTITSNNNESSSLHHQNHHQQPKSKVHTLILCRHGDSIWNGKQPGTKETFTGWTDVPLSTRGIQEAQNIANEIADFTQSSINHGIDALFTSTLTRSQQTAHYCYFNLSSKLHYKHHPKRYISDYRLNERHYGSLQGLVKDDVENGLYGHDRNTVNEWRRSWYAVPPLLDDNDPRRIHEINKFKSICQDNVDNIPKGESLDMVAKNRIRPFLDEVVTPLLDRQSTTTSTTNSERGGTALIIAHANSLRALIGVICSVHKDEKALQRLEAMKIQTAVPLVLQYYKCNITNEYYACDLMDGHNLNHDFFMTSWKWKSLSSTSYSSSSLEYDNIDTDDIRQYCEQKDELMKRRAIPELPVFPLSCIPKQSTSFNDSYISKNYKSVNDDSMKHKTVIRRIKSSGDITSLPQEYVNIPNNVGSFRSTNNLISMKATTHVIPEELVEFKIEDRSDGNYSSFDIKYAQTDCVRRESPVIRIDVI